MFVCTQNCSWHLLCLCGFNMRRPGFDDFAIDLQSGHRKWVKSPYPLRKKLGSHFIQNIRGVGYVIPRETSVSPTSPAEPADGKDHQ